MINYDKVAEKIFAIIKGFGYNLSMYTVDGMDTSVPTDGRRFYVKEPNFMVTLDEENGEIKINKNSHVTLEEIESVMKQLKNLAKQNLLNTQVKVFGKEITPKDFAYQAQKFKDNTMENVVSEASLSRMSGSKKTSYQTLESVKIVVRHRKPVAEEMRGARSRQISAIFLEQGGDRTRFPYNNLVGARAMARHMYEGGNTEDTIGTYIVESVGNILKLHEFVRYARSNKLINEANADVIKTVKENMAVLRGELKGLTGAKSYERMSETISAREVDVLEENDTDELQDMFTVRKFDEKIGDMLPLVRKLMNEKQAWRDALIEASTQTIFMHQKEELAEDDLMEFDSPVQQVGYKIQRVANRMVETGDLQRYVGKVAGKLIEGESINEFEKTIVRNVLENATIKEDEECDDCTCAPCECVGNTFEDVVDAYALKVKMIEHEDIFTEDQCSECGGVGEVWGKACEKCGGEEALEESEGDTCIRCRKGTMEVGDTMYGKQERCNRCGYQHDVREDVNDNDDSEYTCSACGGSGKGDDGECAPCKGWGHGIGRDPATWTDPVGGTHDWNEEDPAAMYEAELADLRRLSGIEEAYHGVEGEYATCEFCDGLGEKKDDPMGLCPECDGSGHAPYKVGSRQDPFSKNFNVGVEDYMDKEDHERGDIF